MSPFVRLNAHCSLQVGRVTSSTFTHKSILVLLILRLVSCALRSWCTWTALRYQTIDVKPVANGIAITHRKKSASPHIIRSAHASTIIGSRTGPRRALGIAAHPAKRGYRPDLRTVSVQYALPSHIYLLQKIRTLVRTHWRRLNVMKDGRGHGCKINSCSDGADQTPLRCRHTLSELVRRKARAADELATTLLVLFSPSFPFPSYLVRILSLLY